MAVLSHIPQSSLVKPSDIISVIFFLECIQGFSEKWDRASVHLIVKGGIACRYGELVKF